MASFGIHVTNNNKSNVTYTYSHPCTYVVGKRQQKWALLGKWFWIHFIEIFISDKVFSLLFAYFFSCVFFSFFECLVFFCIYFSPIKIDIDFVDLRLTVQRKIICEQHIFTYFWLFLRILWNISSSCVILKIFIFIPI